MSKAILAIVVVLVSRACFADSPDDPVLGIKVKAMADVKDDFRKKGYPIPPGGGMLVGDIMRNSPASRAGVHASDVIAIKQNGKVINDDAEFTKWLRTLTVNIPVSVGVYHLSVDGRRFAWKRVEIELTPIRREKAEDDRLRASYLKIDNDWIKLPEIDLSARGEIDGVAVGRVGKVSAYRVVQVLDSKSFIVSLLNARGTDVRVIDFGTAGAADGSVGKFPEPIAIVGTWKYTTVTGAGRTIFVAAPLSVINAGLSDEDLRELKKTL